MSSFYLDVIKDRLYCDGADSLSRRSAQTAIYRILDAITRLLAPILSFTADEIWLAMPHAAGADVRNVCLNDMPERCSEWALTEEEEARWAAVLRVRADVNKALEIARGEKLIGKPLDARVTLYIADVADGQVRALDPRELAPLCIVSEIEIVNEKGEGVAGENVEGLVVHVSPSLLPRCERCWTHDATVGRNENHPSLCERCAEAIG